MDVGVHGRSRQSQRTDAIIWRGLMAGKKIAGKTMRRGALAAALLAMVGLGTAAWLAGSFSSNWRDLYTWYNPAVGFRSAALPVGFEDLAERIKPTVVGVRAKVEREAEEDGPSGRGLPSNPPNVPNGDPGAPQRRAATSLGSGFFISSDGYA